MKTWINVIARIIGVTISLGIILGAIWNLGNQSLITLIPPLLLLILAILSEALICKYFLFFVVGLAVSLFSLIDAGIPFVQSKKSPDLDIIFAVQWILIIFFLLRSYLTIRKKSE